MRESSLLTERLITPIAVRSPLANIGGRALLGEILAFGQGEWVDTVVQLGDASDISCPDEINPVCDALDRSRDDRWFLAPGNPDGLIAGTLANCQPSLGREPVSIYRRPPADGYKGVDTSWSNACLSPSALGDNVRGNVLTKRDAISFYLDRLLARAGAIRTFCLTRW